MAISPDEARKITICCITSQNLSLSVDALVISARSLPGTKVKLFTDGPISGDMFETVAIPKISGFGDYSRFLLHELHHHIDTEFALIIQYDGFVVNPQAWSPAFLYFDYIGARWPWHGTNQVGNGGFSLRSKKLLAATASPLFSPDTYPEDDAIGRKLRHHLEAEHGIRFASPRVADAFSAEFAAPEFLPLGFHGIHLFHRIFGPNELLKVIDSLENGVFATGRAQIWLLALYEEGQTHVLPAVARRILANQTDEQFLYNCALHNLSPTQLHAIAQQYGGQPTVRPEALVSVAIPDLPKRPKIATLISFCSNDYKFLRPAILSVKDVSDEIVVVTCDHFFNGDPENRELIELSKRNNPEARFVEFPFEKGLYPTASQWHNRARAEAFAALKSMDFDWLLLLDADEVADPMFARLVDALDEVAYDSMRILSYWYFRDIVWQAREFEDSAVLLRNAEFLNYEFFLNSPMERLGLLYGRSTMSAHLVQNGAPCPLFHHYSWARTKDEMLRKVAGWGHQKERDWNALIEAEFLRDFDDSCKDFVHGYTYKKVSPPPHFYGSESLGPSDFEAGR